MSAERRVTDRRADAVPVPVDRRGGQRRAQRLDPTPGHTGMAVVVDSWPLMRAGVRQMLADAAIEVVADDVSVAAVAGAARAGVDLAILGVTREPLLDAVAAVQALAGAGEASTGGGPKIMVLLERIDAVELKALLASGVVGVVQRTAGMDELRRACVQVLAGQRVLSGAALSVLASSGLEVALAPADEAARTTDSERLTPKESEVLGHLAQDRSNAEIAGAMHLSGATVKTHLSNIYAKLGVAGRRQAVVTAVERGLLS